jgi:hypothetical protein
MKRAGQLNGFSDQKETGCGCEKEAARRKP